MNYEHLTFIRENLDLSQRELANKLDISKSTYARWETGEKIIPLPHLINLCNLANTSLDYALGLSEHKNKLNTPYIIDKIKIGKNLKRIRIINNLTQKEIAQLLNTTQSVISSYESGKTLIQTSFLYEICIKYKLSTNIIFN
ncbi:MAG: helix-turn-helix transcriptional regulator [Clostridiales bacterium]|nr:helix-turn-helix transcriptional regulator [Clostridiales bacterium]